MWALASRTHSPHDCLPTLNFTYSSKVTISLVAQWFVGIGNNVNSILGLRRLFTDSSFCPVFGPVLPLASPVTL